MRPPRWLPLSDADERSVQALLCRRAEALWRPGRGGLTMDEAYDRDADRAQLLEAVLVHVAFDGWSEAALTAAAKDTGIPMARALNAFPGGAAEMVAHHSESADRAMIEALMREPLSELPIREKVARAIRLRLQANLLFCLVFCSVV